MELEFIKDKVYYKIFDRTYTASSGIYSEHKYNDATKIAELRQNISNIESAYAPSKLCILKQVHGNDVVYASGNAQEADGSVTTDANMALSVLTADCVPVLFASADGAVIGAAHCGWKSAKADIIDNIDKMMKAKGANNIKAIIGPSIQQDSYEVDSGYYSNFIEDDDAYKSLFVPSKKPGYYMFDLPGYVASKLEKAGIELFLHIAEDTYSMQEKYPSCRRSYHNGEQFSQNILSTIIIR